MSPNGRLERWQSPLVLAAALTGIALDALTGVGAALEPLVLPALMALLAGVFVQVTPRQVADAARRLRVVTASVAINFAWAPLVAWLLGALLLADHPELRLGLLLLLVTPCTDWYLIFTDVARGDVPLATSLLPYNLVLQLVLLPVYLYAFAGELVVIPLEALLESVVLVLVVPLVLAAVGRATLPELLGDAFERRLVPALGPVQIVFLALAIAAMFASQGDVLLDNPSVLALLAVPVVVFYAVNFVLGLAVGRLASFSYEETVCLDCTILSRNSPTALAIAVVAFPHEPLIPLALVIGPLLELPLLSVVSQLLLRLRDRGLWTEPRRRSSGSE